MPLAFAGGDAGGIGHAGARERVAVVHGVALVAADLHGHGHLKTTCMRRAVQNEGAFLPTSFSTSNFKKQSNVEV